ncbi:anaphase-promoting complex subunit 1-like [Pollicipes pollicipes]|uniref:anaphase-promoting complex subunit 1-like n=1 Tax=Pollicipes pollicipes TaxID=41117 RepID=UPI001884A612|nr:anaphase-promoting complex subunit 1-like [Pollicipes pollicipes]
MGYQVERLAIAALLDVAGPSVSHQRGKRCRSEDGTDEDWEFLLSSEYHAEVEAEGRAATSVATATVEGRVDATAPLSPHMATLLFVLHLVYEDCKLDTLSADVLPDMAAVLQQLALELGWAPYADHYWRDWPGQCQAGADLASRLSVQGAAVPAAYPYLVGVNELSVHMIMVYALLRGERSEGLSRLLRTVPGPAAGPSGLEQTLEPECADGQPAGSESADDGERGWQRPDAHQLSASPAGRQWIDAELVRLRWPADHRLEEAQQLLRSSRPVCVAAPPRPELSDHERQDEQKRLLYALCQRTMALPAGRGMLSLHAAAPVVTQPLAVPPLCLTGRAPPRGATVDLADMDLPVNMNVWPHFHNGVAAGLRVAPDAAQIDAAWILYNRPKTSAENPVEHAGFLMALGLNGHLAHLARLNVHDYLIKGNEMTSVGVLLGLAACKRGTMDVNTTKLLSIHVESLLPPTSRELDIAHSIQVAAVLGVGLVYQGSNNRHMAEVLLREMSRPPGPEMENSCDREAFALAAGLGLGLVTLDGGGDQLGLTASLHQLIFGGNKPPLTGPQKEKYKTPSYHIREGDTVNTDVTAAGATLALGLMYMGSANRAVSDWLQTPETLYLLDLVRPDLLQLRTLSRALVLWHEVRPSRQWVEQQLPPLVRPDHPPQPGTDCQTIQQVYCHVTSGACLALGLRYAGTADPDAYQVLLHYTRAFIAHTTSAVAEEAGRPTVENCLCVTLTALAMVMAGTGDLEVMRICRYLRSRVGPHHSTVNYGSHMAVHMSLGLLFLGGGRHTLCNSRPAVAALICAFFPRYPLTSCDGRYHLQAFRHLYVLAAEPRLLVPRDLASGQLTYCRLVVTLRTADSPTGHQVAMQAPCLLPQLDTVLEIRVDDDRFWPFTVTSGAGVQLLGERLQSGGRLNVKRKAVGGLHQQELRAQLTQTLGGPGQAIWSAQAELLLSSVGSSLLAYLTGRWADVGPDQHQLCSYLGFFNAPGRGDLSQLSQV